jgi:hypothetical protein
MGELLPGGGTIPCQTQDRVTHISTGAGRFALFAHFAAFVIQTLIA